MLCETAVMAFLLLLQQLCTCVLTSESSARVGQLLVQPLPGAADTTPVGTPADVVKRLQVRSRCGALWLVLCCTRTHKHVCSTRHCTDTAL